MTNSKGYEIGILPECNKLALEQLLNNLIKKGWKPWGEEFEKVTYIREDNIRFFYGTGEKEYWELNIRELVSKESGLWQFVCENGMRPKRVGYAEHYWQRDHHTNGRGMVMESDPEYRVMESALKDESELEYFLLSNIKL